MTSRHPSLSLRQTHPTQQIRTDTHKFVHVANLSIDQSINQSINNVDRHSAP